MNIFRKQEMTVEMTSEFRIGDQIQVGKYTATCQKVMDDTAVFLLDQYLDDAYRMNPTDTNKGGYEASSLREVLRDIPFDENFATIRDHMRPFDNGDLLRLPTIGEMFGNDDFYDCFYEMDDAEQWELMKDRRNRIAEREDEVYEWGWLQNKGKDTAALFALADSCGDIENQCASLNSGVRLVFQLVN